MANEDHRFRPDGRLMTGHGWIRLEPLFATVVGDRLVVDGVVVDRILVDDGSEDRHRRAGGRGEPVTLALTVSPYGNDPTEVDQLVSAFEAAEVVHVFRDEIGTALFLRRAGVWWLLETVED